MAAPPSVDEHLATLPDERRAALEALRQTIRAAAPEATETIAYGMPALRSHGGQFLVSFAAYKAHNSLFPASEAVVEALGEALTPYLAGKGTVRFPADCGGRDRRESFGRPQNDGKRLPRQLLQMATRLAEPGSESQRRRVSDGSLVMTIAGVRRRASAATNASTTPTSRSSSRAA